MASQDGAQEVVLLFDPSGSKVDLEMRYGQFKALLGQKATLDSHAAATVKAAYAQVGDGLIVRAAVFFLFKVNEAGYVDPAFNLPLDYMAQQSGPGPDLGNGPILMASRSQCPVPWHAINMWEPEGEGERHPAHLVQKSVWRNRLQLKTIPVRRRSSGAERPAAAPAGELDPPVESRAVAPPEQRRPAPRREAARMPPAEPLDLTARLDANGRLGQAANGGGVGLARLQAMDQRLTDAFGESGRVSVTQYSRQHREQMGQVADRFRDEMQRQQQSYLEQIRSCREEIQKLKAALRHEKERNRRLQQLLRGDV